MLLRKRLRERGKAQLSEYFKELKEGDKVAIIKNFSYKFSAPVRMQGYTGVIHSKRGRAYVVKVKDGNKEKTLILKSIHLKKLNDRVIKKEK